jgi:hypothetical protein
MNPRAMIAACCLVVLSQSATISRAQDTFEPDPIAIEKFISDIKRLPAPDPGSNPKELSIYLQVLEQGRPLVASPTGIQAFRRRDNLEVITKLVQLAKLDDRPIRVNATLILANVVDNTTACGVINALFDDMNENALFNLLQVINVVSSYALSENRQWITATINHLRSKLDREKFEKSLKLIDQIEKTLNAGSVTVASAKLADLDKASFEACRALPNLQSNP